MYFKKGNILNALFRIIETGVFSECMFKLQLYTQIKKSTIRQPSPCTMISLSIVETRMQVVNYYMQQPIPPTLCLLRTLLERKRERERDIEISNRSIQF